MTSFDLFDLRLVASSDTILLLGNCCVLIVIRFSQLVPSAVEDLVFSLKQFRLLASQLLVAQVATIFPIIIMCI